MTTLDARTLRDWAHRSLALLGSAREEINALNVFPVPDGDTGTNLFLTIESAVTAVDEAADDLAATATALARGALLGARGNSGVIVSQLFRAFADVFDEIPNGHLVSGSDLRAMLRRGADSAYAAVATPIEGTILTVARAAADAAANVASDDVLEVLEAAADGARTALAHTPEQLETLRLAGVVDAGGRGLVVLLDAMVDAVSGVHRFVESVPIAVPITEHVSSGYSGPAFEVMFLLDECDETSIASLKQRLGELGDSLVVVGGAGLWNVHVHVDDAGGAIEAAIAAGRPHRIKITHLLDDEPQLAAGRAIVVVTHGPGTQDLVREAGAYPIPGLANQRVSTGEFLEAIMRTDASEVIVFPSDKDNQATARAAADEARAGGITVAVVPTRSIVQSLAALAVAEPGLRFEDDVVTMTRAAGATHYGAITIAVRDALTFVGPCRTGDVLGLLDGDIVEIGDDLTEVSLAILRRMLATGGDLLTIVVGEDPAAREVARRIESECERAHPALDMVVHTGGQPLWPLIFGVE